MKRLSPAVLFLALLPASLARGQAPTLSHLLPAGVQPGKSLDVVLHGRIWRA
jgi:hypothetical protein